MFVFLPLVFPVNNTSFPLPQQLSQLPQSTESEAGGWGGESYREIKEPLTSLGRSMGCFTRKMDQAKSMNLKLLPHAKRTGLVGCWVSLANLSLLAF